MNKLIIAVLAILALMMFGGMGVALPSADGMPPNTGRLIYVEQPYTITGGGHFSYDEIKAAKESVPTCGDSTYDCRCNTWSGQRSIINGVRDQHGWTLEVAKDHTRDICNPSLYETYLPNKWDSYLPDSMGGSR